MRYQPNRNYVSNDDIETPDWLSEAIVAYFKPTDKILEPCCASGSFLKQLPADTDWCEIKRGRDFLIYEKTGFDWIITNPPWSQIRNFLRKSMACADNVVFLMTVNHAWTKARLRDAREMGFGIKTILLCPMPKEFPQSGFQLGAVHYCKGWDGCITLGEIFASDEIR